MTTPDGAPLLHLPVVYAVALALHDAGVADEEIARRLDLACESMPSLLEIARAKLTAARREAFDDSDRRS